jgi:predicted GNAT superfamily acetyltransferase
MTDRPASPAAGGPFTIRHLERLVEFDACVDLQRTTWGDTFLEFVPGSLLFVSQKVGGLVAGAFTEDERLVGFVFSLQGTRDEVPVHWSHMLAVRPDARGGGLGRRLKLFQREELLKSGVERVFWTFDPLIARNAHLNLNRLGVDIAGYAPNMYGRETGSPLHSMGDTDRLIVQWELASQRTLWAIGGEQTQTSEAAVEAPVIAPSDASERLSGAPELPETSSVLIEIPCDASELATHSPGDARRWRVSTRRAFLHYLGKGYTVQSFHRRAASHRCFYFLRRH